MWLFPRQIYWAPGHTRRISNPLGLFSGLLLFVGFFSSFYIEVQLWSLLPPFSNYLSSVLLEKLDSISSPSTVCIPSPWWDQSPLSRGGRWSVKFYFKCRSLIREGKRKAYLSETVQHLLWANSSETVASFLGFPWEKKYSSSATGRGTQADLVWSLRSAALMTTGRSIIAIAKFCSC